MTCKGVRLQHDPKRKKPYVVWIEVIIGGKETRGAKSYATEAEGQTAYEAACVEITRLRAEAEEDAARRAALAVPELPPAPKGCTLFEPLAKRWIEEHVKVLLSGSSYRNYNGSLTNHLFPIMRTWPVTHEVMSPKRLKDVLKTQLFDKGLSLTHRHACHATLSAFFGWAKGELPPGQLLTNPAEGLARYIRNESEKDVELDQVPNPMTRVQVEALLAWLLTNKPDLYDLFLWLADEGTRLGEACALAWDKLDLDRGRAHIVRAFSSGERWKERRAGKLDSDGEKDTKTHRKNQFNDISPRVIARLQKRRVTNREAWMKRGRRGPEPVHVFITNRLTARKPDHTLYDAFRDGCEALELVGQTGEAFTIHCLRDTFATLSILEGKKLGWVSMMLGHADEATTRKHYYRWIRLSEDNVLAADGEQ